MRSESTAGVAGSLLAAATAVLYVVVIDVQGTPDRGRVASVAIVLVACAVGAMYASWALSPKVRSVVFAIAAGALLGLGWLAIFSVGLPLLAAGVLLLVATSKALAEDFTSKALAEDASGTAIVAVLCGAIALAGAPTFVLWLT